MAQDNVKQPLDYNGKLEKIDSLVLELGYGHIDGLSVEILRVINEASLKRLSKDFKPDNVSF